MKRLKTLGDAQDVRFVLIAAALACAVLLSDARAQDCPCPPPTCCSGSGLCELAPKCVGFQCPCPDGRCVESSTDCTTQDCPEGQFQCGPPTCCSVSGLCEKPPPCAGFQCPCPDGRCVFDSSQCEGGLKVEACCLTGGCKNLLPKECSFNLGRSQGPGTSCLQPGVCDVGGNCPSGETDCGPPTCCSEGLLCVKPGICPLGSVRCPCPDGRCVSNLFECAEACCSNIDGTCFETPPLFCSNQDGTPAGPGPSCGAPGVCGPVPCTTALIDIHAATHTVGSGAHPGSSKSPLGGITVCAYDKSESSCARTKCPGISHQHYLCILKRCTPTSCCITDKTGECTIEAPPGDYIVIAGDATLTKTVLPDPLGVSASDLVCGELMQKHLQQIIKVKDGIIKKTPGKTTRRTGSELLIIEPEFVVWDGTVQEYPFVFETVGDWGITASVAPPEGFVSDYDSLSTDVYSAIEAVQFTITEVGSDLVPTGTTFEVTHRGRREFIHSQIGIFLTPEYARSRGFNVAQLRAAGLIKELPAQAQSGQNQRPSGDE